jgi:hypothetical protein
MWSSGNKEVPWSLGHRDAPGTKHGHDRGSLQEVVDAKDNVVEVIVDEASHWVCQARGHVRDECTRRFCQHRSCIDRDEHELFTLSNTLADEASRTVAAQNDTGVEGAIIAQGCRTRQSSWGRNGNAHDGHVLDEDECVVDETRGSMKGPRQLDVEA